MLSILRRTKKFLPIGKTTAHFAHRFFSIQVKLAHYSKNLGCVTVLLRNLFSFFVSPSRENFVYSSDTFSINHNMFLTQRREEKRTERKM